MATAVLLTLFAGAACGDATMTDGVPVGDDVAEVGELQQGLGSGEGCPTLAPDGTCNGSGSVTTGRTYDHSTCWTGYLLDINDYDPSNAGTLVYDPDTVPTTEAGCTGLQLRVYAWRRNPNGTTTYLGGRFPHGTWVTSSGAPFCKVPSVHVDASFPEFKADRGDYRLGIRAQDLSSGTMKRRKIYVETVGRVDRDAQRTALRQELTNTPAGTIIQKVKDVWALRAGGRQQMQCRGYQVTRSLYDFSRASFIKAGSSAAAVDAARSAVDAMYGALCAPGASEAQVQATLKQYLDASDRMRREIATAIAPTTAGGTDPQRIALNVMNEIVMLDVGRLVQNCNLTADAALNYVIDGTLPNGVSADRLMLGTCAGTPAQVGSSLGVGGHLAAAATRAALRACLAPPDVAGAARDVCDDPRANGAASEDGKPKPAGCIRPDGQPCTPAEQQADQAKTAAEEEERRAAAQRVADRELEIFRQGVEAGRRYEQERIRQEQERNRPDPLERIVDIFLNTMTGNSAVTILGWIEQASGVRIFDPCPAGPGQCEAYCAADFASGGYYGSVQDFNYGAARQLNQFDLASHCLCQAMEEEYAARTGVDVTLSSACPSAQNQLQQQCLANPYGPDDKPRPECVRFLLPGNISDSSWQGRICNAKRCPESMVAAFDVTDGSCECEAPQRPLGGLTDRCPISTVAMCTDDNPGPCQCLPADNGGVPHGNDPLCRLDPSSWPGSYDALLPSNPKAVTLHRQAAETYVMMDARVERAPSFVTANYNREAFSKLGTVLRQRALISATPRVGENLDLQVYCTNLGNNLIHSFMGQCRLNSLTPGAPGSCDIPLNAGTRAACLGGKFNLEYVSQAPAAYTGRMGAGPWTFQGDLSTPAIVNPVCPAPDPFRVFPQSNPLWALAGGTPQNPVRVFESFDGVRNTIPPNLFLVDRTNLGDLLR